MESSHWPIFRKARLLPSSMTPSMSCGYHDELQAREKTRGTLRKLVQAVQAQLRIWPQQEGCQGLHRRT